jgi:hypothetical protein
MGLEGLGIGVWIDGDRLVAILVPLCRAMTGQRDMHMFASDSSAINARSAFTGLYRALAVQLHSKGSAMMCLAWINSDFY